MQLSVYENRMGGFDLKDADSTLLLPLASARSKAMADKMARRYNSHEALVRALKAAAVCLDPESEAAGIRLTKEQRAEALAMVYAALKAGGAK